MNGLIQRNTAGHDLEFLLVSSTDGATPVYGATPVVAIKKEGGTWGAPIGAISECALPAPTFPGSVFTAAATTGGNLTDATTYYYKITALNVLGETSPSAEQNVTTGSSANTNKVTINWTAVPGATGYNIYRSTTTGTELLLATVGNVTSYADTSATTPSGALPSANTTSGGHYKVAANATDSNTLGTLCLTASASGAVPTDSLWQVVAYNPDDPAALGLANLVSLLSKFPGSAYSAQSGDAYAALLAGIGVRVVTSGTAAASSAVPVATDFTIGAANYWQQLFAANGLDSTGWTKMYFSIKRDVDEDGDTDAMVLVRITSLPAPAVGSLTSSASGALGATTYFVRTTYTNATGETWAGPEKSLAVAANHVLVVPSPGASGNATGWNVYVSTTTNTETLQNLSPIAIGTPWTEPTSGLIAGAALPTADTAQGVSGDGLIRFMGQTPGDATLASVRVTGIYPNTNITVTLAAGALNIPPSGTGTAYQWELTRFIGLRKERVGTGNLTVERTVLRDLAGQ